MLEALERATAWTTRVIALAGAIALALLMVLVTVVDVALRQAVARAPPRVHAAVHAEEVDAAELRRERGGRHEPEHRERPRRQVGERGVYCVGRAVRKVHAVRGLEDRGGPRRVDLRYDDRG